MKFLFNIFFNLKDKKGFSLIEMIVAMGVGVVFVGFTTDLLVKQHKEQKLLAQKLEINDFKNNLLSILAKKNNCTCQFLNNSSNPNLTNYSVLQFDSTIIDGSQSINTQQMYSGCAGTHAPILLASNGQLLHGSQSLIVDTVRVTDLRPSGGSLNPYEWTGKWEINIRVGSGSLDRPIKPILVTQKFMIDPTVPTAARIASCEGASSGSGSMNYLTKWSSIPGVIEDAGIYQDPVSANLGIGTTTPASQFHIMGLPNSESFAGIFSQSSAVGGTGGICSVDSSSRIDGCVGGYTKADVYGVNDGAIGDYVMVSNGNIRFSTNNPGWTLSSGIVAQGSKMSILTNGNVGIGTPSPIKPLHIVSSDPLGSATMIQSSDVGGKNYGLVSSGSSSSGGVGKFHIYDWDVSRSLMVFDSSGNSGIGTINPIAPLHVFGSSSQQVARVDGAHVDSTALWITNSSPGGRAYALASTANGNPILGGKFTIADASAGGINRLVIDSTGKVGIGETAPSGTLEVNGGIRAKKGLPDNVNFSQMGFSFEQDGDSGMFSVGGSSSTASDIAFVTDGAERIRLSIGGNVGIGTTAPVYKLDVVGGVNASGGYTSVSDIRLKDDIQYLDSKSILEKVITLNGITYSWKNKNLFGKEKQLGLIAQEVLIVFPESVKKDSKGVLSVNYSSLVSVLIESIKELKTQNDSLKEKLEEQNKRIERLEYLYNQQR